MKKGLLIFICITLPLWVRAQHMESVYETVRNISLGWNYGCAFDGSEWQRYGTPGFVVNYEEGSDFPPATEDLFQMAAQNGVDAVRIMIMWGEFVDNRTMEIRKDMFDRIQEVADYIINSGMYCILSMKSDPSSEYERLRWFSADYSNYPEISRKYKEIWRQVAERFREYGPLLIFDSFNEIVDANGNWENAPQESYDATNMLNQDFVNVVRATGGNNIYRNLLVSIYTGQSDSEEKFEAFKFPNDVTDEKHIFVSHHIYYIDPDARRMTQSFSVPKINHVLELLNKYFISKDIPVIMGESGMCPLTVPDVTENDRCEYYEYLLSKASQYGISALAWDDVIDGSDRYYRKLSSPACLQVMKNNSPVKGRAIWNSSGKFN